ncbi:MAG: alpha-ketoglutarate-dependent dioxygenase AlkB [Myxococcota bacterium]
MDFSARKPQAQGAAERAHAQAPSDASSHHALQAWGLAGNLAAGMQTEMFSAEEPLPRGVTLFRQRLDEPAQCQVLDAILDVIHAAPPLRLTMKNGAQLINRMTNCGALGWHSDARGYRYLEHHPETGAPWPAIPPDVMAVAVELAARCGVAGYAPDACLVNLYAADGRLSLHRDHDECDFSWPIVSFSFGAEAVFVLGGFTRREPVREVLLRSGDVLVLHGPSRTRYHGVKKILSGTAPFEHPAIPARGRLNLTCRRAR